MDKLSLEDKMTEKQVRLSSHVWHGCVHVWVQSVQQAPPPNFVSFMLPPHPTVGHCGALEGTVGHCRAL